MPILDKTDWLTKINVENFVFFTFFYTFAHMSNREFLRTLNKGDFIVAESNQHKSKLLACFDSFAESEWDKTDNFYTVNAVFFIGYLGGFRTGIPFGVMDEHTSLRKAEMGEIFKISDEVRRNGYIYNRREKTLSKRPV